MENTTGFMMMGLLLHAWAMTGSLTPYDLCISAPKHSVNEVNARKVEHAQQKLIEQPVDASTAPASEPSRFQRFKAGVVTLSKVGFNRVVIPYATIYGMSATTPFIFEERYSRGVLEAAPQYAFFVSGAALLHVYIRYLQDH